MKRAFFLLFLLCAFLHTNASQYASWWKKGNDYYQQKQYDSAAYYFEQITQLKPQNAEVYYNLGNTYYRLNKIGAAVLNYERALHINPEYKDASDNLTLTQSRISNRINPINEIFFVSWWKNISDKDNAMKWTICSLVLFLLVIALLFYNRLNKSGKKLSSKLTGAIAVVWILCIVMAFIATENTGSSHEAVVMQNDAPLMSNTVSNKAISLVPEGTKVELLSENGAWTEVRLPDGRKGWLRQSQLTVI